MHTLPITSIEFPDTHLSTRDGHKLRGYFGNVFREHSTLLHNHFEDGTLRHEYPLVQYKVVRHIGTLVGLGEGAELLRDLFLDINEINIEGLLIQVNSKNIHYREETIGPCDGLRSYSFNTLWMALNQQNYREYLDMSAAERHEKLTRILVGNILVFFRRFGLEVRERILARPEVVERSTMFKDQKMLVFQGGFVANVQLPDLIGLGKSVSRGFGCITGEVPAETPRREPAQQPLFKQLRHPGEN